MKEYNIYFFTGFPPPIQHTVLSFTQVTHHKVVSYHSHGQGAREAADGAQNHLCGLGKVS